MKLIPCDAMKMNQREMLRINSTLQFLKMTRLEKASANIVQNRHQL